MTKQLFEEALADVKQVRKVAEEDALRALTKAVAPRIREFIDRAFLNEDEDIVGVVEEPVVADPTPVAAAISMPDAEGKVTLDIDALCNGTAAPAVEPTNVPGPAVPPPMFGAPAPRPDDADAFEVSAESIRAIKPLVAVAKRPLDVSRAINELLSGTKRLCAAGEAVRETRAYAQKIAETISSVEDMYGHVQEAVSDHAKRSSYGASLEEAFRVLTKLQELTNMSKKINEADLTLKLTGLPDDVEDNLDSVGVDLISGDEDGGEDAEGGGEDVGLGDLDLDTQQEPEEGGDTQMENRRLSDDTIVEIDENMLRREIARMRALREETKPAAWGDGPGGANILDDFGGGKDHGDPTVDAEIADLSPGKASRPLGESDEDDLDEQDQMDQGDDQMDQGVHPARDMAMQEQDQDDLDEQDDQMDQLQNRRKEDEYGTSVSDGHETATWDKRRHEGLNRLAFEKKLQERAKLRASSLKKEAARAKAAGNAKRLAEAKQEYAVVSKRYNQSLARCKKVSALVAQATKAINEAHQNGAAKRPAGAKADQILRKKLAEANLFNAKLLFTNKLLQNDQLTARQKAQVIRQLDEARTVREAKLVYESLARTLAPRASTPIREGAERRVLGSASRATKPASTQTLNEGYETERWAKLAGIVK